MNKLITSDNGSAFIAFTKESLIKITEEMNDDEEYIIEIDSEGNANNRPDLMEALRSLI